MSYTCTTYFICTTYFTCTTHSVLLTVFSCSRIAGMTPRYIILFYWPYEWVLTVFCCCLDEWLNLKTRRAGAFVWCRHCPGCTLSQGDEGNRCRVAPRPLSFFLLLTRGLASWYYSSFILLYLHWNQQTNWIFQSKLEFNAIVYLSREVVSWLSTDTEGARNSK